MAIEKNLRNFWKIYLTDLIVSDNLFMELVETNQSEMQLIEGRIHMKTLKDIKVNETTVVVKVHGDGPVRRRIMDMGITKGVEIYVRKVAPLGDPMELNLRGYELTLRKADASMIEVE